VNTSTIREYLKARKPHYQPFSNGNGGQVFQTPAKNVLREIRIRQEWAKHECEGDGIPEIGSVRLRIEPDDSVDMEDLFGDTFNPTLNPKISEAKLERQKKEEVDRVNRDGVWGVIGEYWDGEEWQTADSCWGFIGEDWKESGYDVDIMSQTLEQAAKVETCPTCHRPLKKD